MHQPNADTGEFRLEQQRGCIRQAVAERLANSEGINTVLCVTTEQRMRCARSMSCDNSGKECPSARRRMDNSSGIIGRLFPVSCFIVCTVHRPELDAGVLFICNQLRILDQIDHLLTIGYRVEELHIGGFHLYDRYDDL